MGEGISLKEAYENFMGAGNYEKAYACLFHWYKASKKESIPYIHSFRDYLQKLMLDGDTDELLSDVLKRSYDLTAPDCFDDFMIALEWDRDVASKFWLPRRSKLLEACNVLQQMEEGQIDELFLSMPPRVGKTTLVVFFILWVMLRDPERSNLYSSYTDSVVNTFYSGLLEILTDTVTYRWQEIFPGRKIAGTNSREYLLNIDRKKRYSSLTCRSLYGTLNGACDCNGYIIGDDLISGIEEALNKDRLNSAWLKVDNNLIPRAKQNAKRLWIGTRWSLVDPIARRLDLVENDSRYASVKYKVINFPALDANDESNFEYACGVGFDTEYFRQRRASFERNNDLASWNAQYQQTPTERNGAVFEPEDLRYFNGDLPSEVEPDRVFMACDPAWGGGDYVAAPIIFVYGDDWYVVDVVYNNGDKAVTIPEIVNKAIHNGVSAIVVEGTRVTRSYADEVDTKLKEKGYRCNVQSTTKNFTMTGKEQRIFDKAPDIRQMFLFLNTGYRSKEYEMFMQNMYSFTFNGKNKHDDAPDSIVIALTTGTLSYRMKVKQRHF